MLMGFPTAFSQTKTAVTDRHSWYEAAFVQDDYTIARNLTLNIGLRWEMDTPMIDANDYMNGFDLHQINPVSGTPGVVKFMGENGYRTSPWDTDWNNFGPRFGFAWRPGSSIASWCAAAMQCNSRIPSIKANRRRRPWDAASMPAIRRRITG